MLDSSLTMSLKKINLSIMKTYTMKVHYKSINLIKIHIMNIHTNLKILSKFILRTSTQA